MVASTRLHRKIQTINLQISDGASLQGILFIGADAVEPATQFQRLNTTGDGQLCDPQAAPVAEASQESAADQPRAPVNRFAGSSGRRRRSKLWSWLWTRCYRSGSQTKALSPTHKGASRRAGASTLAQPRRDGERLRSPRQLVYAGANTRSFGPRPHAAPPPQGNQSAGSGHLTHACSRLNLPGPTPGTSLSWSTCSKEPWNRLY